MRRMKRELRGQDTSSDTPLLAASTFSAPAVTGVLSAVRAFSIHIVGLHSLMGLLSIVLIGCHVANSHRPLKAHLRSKVLWVCFMSSRRPPKHGRSCAEDLLQRRRPQHLARWVLNRLWACDRMRPIG